jgi:hypothetical protein
MRKLNEAVGGCVVSSMICAVYQEVRIGRKWWEMYIFIKDIRSKETTWEA